MSVCVCVCVCVCVRAQVIKLTKVRPHTLRLNHHHPSFIIYYLGLPI